MAGPRLRRALTFPLVLVAATWLFAEEVLWEGLNRLLGALGRLPGLRALERWIASLPPYAALALFIVPAVVLLPFKIAALWLIARGHVIAGAQMFVLAKVTGTAIAARIFTLCRPALLSKPWFARGYAWTIRTRDLVHARMAETRAWQAMKRTMAGVRHWTRTQLARWRAAGDARRGSLVRRFRAVLRLWRIGARRRRRDARGPGA